MGKKNKKKSQISTSSTSCDNFISLEDEIIQHLQLLKEAGGLVIGLNAVLRELKKKSFCVVILISREATSAMYHALNMLCRNTDIIFLKLRDISCITSHSKLPSSTAYGIRTMVLDEQKFEKLRERINNARNSQKFKKQRKVECLLATNENELSNENFSCAEDSQYNSNENSGPAKENHRVTTENPSQRRGSSSFNHASHDTPILKFTGNEDGFLTIKDIDFPNYNCRSNEITFCIK